MALLTTRISAFGRTETTFSAFSDQVMTDAAKANGGLGEHPNPVMLLCASFAACTLTVVIMAARKLNLSTEGCYVELVDLQEDVDRYVVTRIALLVHLRADYDEVVRKRMEAYVSRGCFVGNSLSCEHEVRFVYE